MKNHWIKFGVIVAVLLRVESLFGEEPGGLIPLAKPPQNLMDEFGNVELDLIDPFQRSAGDRVVTDSDGFSFTSRGEVSDEFRILGIVIPENEARKPVALIQLTSDSDPYLVRVGDLIRISQKKPDVRMISRYDPARSSTMSALETYAFYLHIKDIQPTYIEAYQKKKPNETIYLRW